MENKFLSFDILNNDQALQKNATPFSITMQPPPPDNGLMIQGHAHGVNTYNISLTEGASEYITQTQNLEPQNTPSISNLVHLSNDTSALPYTESVTHIKDEPATATIHTESTNTILETTTSPNGLLQRTQTRPKPKISSKQKLRDIASCATRLCAPKGNAAITDYGDKQKPPSDLQIVQERHLIKTTQILQKSFNTYQHKLSPLVQPVSAVVYVTYLANGFIDKATITRSSGSREIDAFIIFLFEDIYNEVPPVPKRLTSLLYNGFSWTIRILPTGFYIGT
jgi:hypothetical protein